MPDTNARRIAIAGAGGRLGSALVHGLASRPGVEPLAWSRPAFDLDDPAGMRACVERAAPDLVILAAAWTDVDGCARDPALAMARNGEAVGVVAEACVASGAGLVLVSTNEVFDGERTDGRGYAETDPTSPRNPYGVSKLAGERAASAAFGGREGLWIVRTAWLFGPPGSDFPHKIAAAADELPSDEPLPVVVDEFGSPTYTPDLAQGILDLVASCPAGGTYHLVNGGIASRLDWAARVLRAWRPGRGVSPISRTAYDRASQPPAWGVLDAARAAQAGVALRPWTQAVDAYSEGDGTARG